MDSNQFQNLRAGGLDRDLWLNDLQRQFSADMDNKSELFFNSSAHVDGCSSESEEEYPRCRSNRRNHSSFLTSCSGASKRLSKDEQIDNLVHIVKLHDQHISLLQNQIKFLVDLVHSVCKVDVKDVLLPKTEDKNMQSDPVLNDPVDSCRKVVDDSDFTPKCIVESSVDQPDHNFFSTVMGTLRGMLVESNEPDAEPTSDKILLNATMEQLKNLGVSYIERMPPPKKQVTFCDNEPVRTESSAEIDSLARKYLISRGNPQQMSAAFDQIHTLQKRSTDLSLATVKYLKRYKLSPDNPGETKRPDDEGNAGQILLESSRARAPRIENKILDSTAIRSQPKLAPKKQWLLRKN